jgi:hypothetical protein
VLALLHLPASMLAALLLGCSQVLQHHQQHC